MQDLADEGVVSHSYAGSITNLLVIPQSSLIPMKTNQRGSNNFRVSLLDKYPKAVTSSKGTIPLLPSSCSLEDHNTTTSVYRSTDLMNQQILEMEVLSPSLSLSSLYTCFSSDLGWF